MGRHASQPVLWSVFAGLLLALAGIAGLTNPTFANSTDVTLNVPVGYILVQGKTSPNALVKIYENGNSQPAASITANGSGAFSQELPQDTTGLVDITIRATDTSGVKSMPVTKQVAIIAQQTSSLNVIMPPTISVNPASAVFRTGSLTFSGQTVPDSSVKVTVEPSTVITDTADSQGNYSIPLLVESLPSVGIYSYGVEVTTGTEMSDYAVAGTFVVSPPIQAPITPPGRPFQEIINTITRPEVQVPEITYPGENEITSAEPIILAGRAEPGAIITIYDGDSVIGSVVAGENGEWQYYFSPFKDMHVLSAVSCVVGRCSEKSRGITILRPKTEALPACRPGVTLESYRLTTKTNSPVSVVGMLPKESNGLLYISWGDETNDRFDKPAGDQLKAAHTYQKAGNYSGYVILNDSKVCQTATYFAVEVTDPLNPVSTITVVAAAAIGTISLWLLIARLLPLLRA